MKKDTIAAIATAMSNSGIGIVRISGEESIDIVKKIDPEAFVSISSTHAVFGEGYRNIKDYSNK